MALILNPNLETAESFRDVRLSGDISDQCLTRRDCLSMFLMTARWIHCRAYHFFSSSRIEPVLFGDQRRVYSATLKYHAKECMTKQASRSSYIIPHVPKTVHHSAIRTSNGRSLSW